MYMQNMALAIRHGLLFEWNGLVGFHDSACISSNRVVIGWSRHADQLLVGSHYLFID